MVGLWLVIAATVMLLAVLMSWPKRSSDTARTVAVGDFNGDTHPDLAIANFNSDIVSCC